MEVRVAIIEPSLFSGKKEALVPYFESWSKDFS